MSIRAVKNGRSHLDGSGKAAPHVSVSHVELGFNLKLLIADLPLRKGWTRKRVM